MRSSPSSDIEHVARLEDDIERLTEKLERRWGWLDDHPDHPEFEARTDRFIDTLRRYEVACDSLRIVRSVLGG